MREKLSYAAALTAVLTLVVAGPAEAATPTVQCIAHRGGAVAGHTEETIPTYETTLTAHPTIEVEGDVRWTRTGFPMLLHDPALDRFGAPETDLADLSVGQAKTFVADTGDTMASLWELRTLLLAYPGARVQLELKEPMTPARWATLETRLGVLGARVTLTSFSLATVRQAQDEGYRAGLLSATDNPTTAAGIFIEHFAQVDETSVSAHRARGVQTQTYTPDSPADWTAVASDGVTAIITNKPTACLAWASGQPWKWK